MRIGKFAVVAVLVVAFGLSACGRRGPLEAPPGDDRKDSPIVLDELIL